MLSIRHGDLQIDKLKNEDAILGRKRFALCCSFCRIILIKVLALDSFLNRLKNTFKYIVFQQTRSCTGVINRSGVVWMEYFVLKF